MTETERFPSLTAESAPAAARPMVVGSEKAFGFLPSPVARAAHSPALLKHLLAGFRAFDESTLTSLEREVVAFTVAFEIECHYCMAMHSALLSRDPTSRDVVAALREGTPLEDRRLEALRGFVRAVVGHRGRVPAEDWAALDAAGFSREQSLDALLGTSVYLLSTLTNVLTDAPLDPPFTAHAWHRPTPA